MLTIRDGTVVDVDGVRRADVEISGEQITRVETVSSATDREIDASNQYVVPGLVDAHVHLSFSGAADPTQHVGENTGATAFRVARNLRTLQRTGVTAVRDLGSPANVAIDARDAVRSGTIPGPTVVPAGQNITMTGGHGHWFGREADSVDEIQRAVREQMKAGADVVKLMATGGVLTEGAQTGAPELTEEELSIAVDEAHKQGLQVAVHAHGLEGIRNAIRAGVDSVEHGTFMDRESAAMMAERDIWWVPTARAITAIIQAGTDAGIPEHAVRKANAAIDAFVETFDHVLAEDVPIAMGTDAGTPFNGFESAPREIELMVEHGLDPTHAMEVATVGAAELLGLEDRGRIAEGYRADLMILSTDPTEDASSWQSPDAIICGGERIA